MNCDWQKLVEDFHKELDLEVGSYPKLRDGKMRASLIAEEAGETCAAIDAGDLPEAVDGICDLIYVALGCAVAWGIDLEPFFMEVHRTNMAKLGGPVRADGKKLKPVGWKPPNIKGLLAAQLNRHLSGE